jgi:hypothetical protein
MRPNVFRAELEASADAMFPAASDAVPGLQCLPPLLRAVLAAYALNWQGTMRVRDDQRRPLCELHVEAGWLIVGRAGDADDGRVAVRQACGNRAAHVTIVAHTGRSENLSSSTHLMDPLALTGDIVRSGLVEDAVNEAVAAIGGRSLKLRAHTRAELERYGLTPEERQLVQRLSAGPQTLTALRERESVCASTLHQLVFLLWVTESVSVVPLWLSASEREHSAPRPGASYIRSLREDEPTTVVRSDTQPDALMPRESVPWLVRRHPTLPYGAQAPAQGAHRDNAPADAREVLSARPAARDRLPRCRITLRERADAHFHAAEVLLHKGFARDAVFEAQKGMRLCQPQPAQRALYAYLLFVRGGLRPGVESCIKQHLNQALREAPDCERTRFYAKCIGTGQLSCAIR